MRCCAPASSNLEKCFHAAGQKCLCPYCWIMETQRLNCVNAVTSSALVDVLERRLRGIIRSGDESSQQIWLIVSIVSVLELYHDFSAFIY